MHVALRNETQPSGKKHGLQERKETQPLLASPAAIFNVQASVIRLFSSGVFTLHHHHHPSCPSLSVPVLQPSDPDLCCEPELPVPRLRLAQAVQLLTLIQQEPHSQRHTGRWCTRAGGGTGGVCFEDVAPGLAWHGMAVSLVRHTLARLHMRLVESEKPCLLMFLYSSASHERMAYYSRHTEPPVLRSAVPPPTNMLLMARRITTRHSLNSPLAARSTTCLYSLPPYSL